MSRDNPSLKTVDHLPRWIRASIMYINLYLIVAETTTQLCVHHAYLVYFLLNFICFFFLLSLFSLCGKKKFFFFFRIPISRYLASSYSASNFLKAWNQVTLLVRTASETRVMGCCEKTPALGECTGDIVAGRVTSRHAFCSRLRSRQFRWLLLSEPGVTNTNSRHFYAPTCSKGVSHQHN